MRKDQFLDSVHSAALSRVFSPMVINELAKTRKSKYLKVILEETEFISLVDLAGSLRSCFDLVYSQVEESYRNEYVYKNTIAQKILLGRHSLNTAAMHTEFRVSRSKADILILNGTSHIYEIKSELDSLERITKQLADYQQFSEYVSVVASEKHVEKLKGIDQTSVGIILLTDKKTLKVVRKATSCRGLLSKSVIFDSLRKSEYMDIAHKITGRIPSCSNALMYRECKSVVDTIDVGVFHDLAIHKLKARDSSQNKKELILAVPNSLKSMVIGSKFTKAQSENLLMALDKNLEECLN